METVNDNDFIVIAYAIRKDTDDSGTYEALEFYGTEQLLGSALRNQIKKHFAFDTYFDFKETLEVMLNRKRDMDEYSIRAFLEGSLIPIVERIMDLMVAPSAFTMLCYVNLITGSLYLGLSKTQESIFYVINNSKIKQLSGIPQTCKVVLKYDFVLDSVFVSDAMFTSGAGRYLREALNLTAVQDNYRKTDKLMEVVLQTYQEENAALSVIDRAQLALIARNFFKEIGKSDFETVKDSVAVSLDSLLEALIPDDVITYTAMLRQSLEQKLRVYELVNDNNTLNLCFAACKEHKIKEPDIVVPNDYGVNKIRLGSVNTVHLDEKNKEYRISYADPKE